MAEQYRRALTDIFVSKGVRAHRAGELVPARNVKANGWESLTESLKPKAKTSSES